MSKAPTPHIKKHARSANKLNVRLLRSVQKHILEEPRRLDMDQWCVNDPNSPCGTAACIAGWTTRLSGRYNVKFFGKVAAKLLGITYAGFYSCVFDKEVVENSEASRLFLPQGWPKKYQDSYRRSLTPASRARTTAQRIDHFIKYRK